MPQIMPISWFFLFFFVFYTFLFWSFSDLFFFSKKKKLVLFMAKFIEW